MSGVVAKALIEGLDGLNGQGVTRSGAADEVAQRWAIWRSEKASRRQDDRGRRDQRRGPVRCAQQLRADERHHAGRRRQQHLLVRPLLRSAATERADVGLPRVDRLLVARRDGLLGCHTEPTGIRRPPGRVCFWRRRFRSVRHGDDHSREVRHEHHPRVDEQQRTRQDLQGTTSGRLRRLADLPAQPRLRGLRRTVRSQGNPGHRDRRAAFSHRRGDRLRRPRIGRFPVILSKMAPTRWKQVFRLSNRLLAQS